MYNRPLYNSNMTSDSAPKKEVKTLSTSFDIIGLIKQSNGARVSEIASELGLAKSTVHRHLYTLKKHEYLVKEGDIYQLSLKFLDAGEYSRRRHDEYELIKPKVNELAEQTQERAQYLIEEHGRGVVMCKSLGSNAVHTDPGLGKRIPLHSISAGKAILAHLPKPHINYIIQQHGLDGLTAATITEPEVLFDELDKIRQRGYAINEQERIKGLCSIGVPVKHQTSNHILGSISISGPVNRMKGERFQQELPDLLLGVANELELNIGSAKPL